MSLFYDLINKRAKLKISENWLDLCKTEAKNTNRQIWDTDHYKKWESCWLQAAEDIKDEFTKQGLCLSAEEMQKIINYHRR